MKKEFKRVIKTLRRIGLSHEKAMLETKSICRERGQIRKLNKRISGIVTWNEYYSKAKEIYHQDGRNLL